MEWQNPSSSPEGDTIPPLHVDEFREIVREVLDQELGISDVRLGGRWQGGTLVLQPVDMSAKAKEIPLETFFHKIIMVRDRLRMLEAKINGHKTLTAEDKIELEQYLTRIYGSLTTFNILFSDKDGQFKGSGGAK